MVKYHFMTLKLNAKINIMRFKHFKQPKLFLPDCVYHIICLFKFFQACFLLECINIVVIITWPSEKPSQKKKQTLKSQLSGPLIRSNGLCLWKISSLLSQFSINQRTFSLFCCFLFAVFNNCWSTAPSFPFNSYTN